MKNLIKLKVITSLIFPVISLAELSQNPIKSKVDIPDFNQNKIRIGTFIEVPANDILLSVDEGRGSLLAKDKRIEFRPSGTSTWGLHLSYNLLDLKYKTYIFNDDSHTVQKYGKSNYNDFSVKYDFGFLQTKFYHQETKGFYADLNSNSGTTIGSKNTPQAQKNLEEDIWIRPDLKAINWGFNLGLSFPIYDPRDPRQLIPELNKTTGNGEEFNFGFHLISAFDYSNFSVEGDDYFIPPMKRSNFGEDFADLKGIGYQRLGLDLGLKVIFYFSESFTLYFLGMGGPGVQSTQKIYSNRRRNTINFAEHLNFDIGVVYKTNKHKFKSSFEVDSWGSQIDGGNLDVQKTAFLLSYTYSI